MTARFIAKQIKRLDQLSWLSRVLRKHQFLNISLERVLTILHQLCQTVSILESGCIKLQNVNCVHLVNIVGHILKFLSVQLERLTSQM